MNPEDAERDAKIRDLEAEHRAAVVSFVRRLKFLVTTIVLSIFLAFVCLGSLIGWYLVRLIASL